MHKYICTKSKTVGHRRTHLILEFILLYYYFHTNYAFLRIRVIPFVTLSPDPLMSDK